MPSIETSSTRRSASTSSAVAGAGADTARISGIAGLLPRGDSAARLSPRAVDRSLTALAVYLSEFSFATFRERRDWTLGLRATGGDPAARRVIPAGRLAEKEG